MSHVRATRGVRARGEEGGRLDANMVVGLEEGRHDEACGRHASLLRGPVLGSVLFLLGHLPHAIRLRWWVLLQPEHSARMSGEHGGPKAPDPRLKLVKVVEIGEQKRLLPAHLQE